MTSMLQEMLVRHLIFPTYEKLRGRQTMDVLSKLEKSQWFSSSDLLDLQDEKLFALVGDAQSFCPFYRERLKGELSSRKDLGCLPFLTRRDLQDYLDDIVDERTDRSQLSKAATGGSTGHPVHFYLDRNRAAFDIAAKIRARRWWGVNIGAREVIFWGSPVEFSSKNRWVTLKDRFLNATFFSAFQMRSEDMAAYHAMLQKIRPEIVFGYASTLFQFAEFLDAEGLRLSDLRIKVVVATAEILFDFMRERISMVFGCPVANEYGSRDGGYIAHECPEHRMHITAESVVLECLDEESRPCPLGVEGELALTNLDNHAMPLIRYRIGDRGALSEEECPCGRGLPILKMISGRTHDVIRKTDGSPIHPLFLIYIIRPLKGVRQFRVVQHSLQIIEVLLVTDTSFDRSNNAYIVSKYKEHMGEEMNVFVKNVESIPPTSSGKHRWIVSELE